MRIYLAGPFFSDEQIARVAKLEQALAANPSVDEVFSPRLDKSWTGEEGTPAWADYIFKMDTSQIDQADALVVVHDYLHANMDSGTAFEVGYAYRSQTPIVVVQELTDEPVNLMIGQALQTYLTDPNEIATLDFNNLPTIPYEGKTF